MNEWMSATNPFYTFKMYQGILVCYLHLHTTDASATIFDSIMWIFFTTRVWMEYCGWSGYLHEMMIQQLVHNQTRTKKLDAAELGALTNASLPFSLLLLN
jgi:hypothetical protein